MPKVDADHRPAVLSALADLTQGQYSRMRQDGETSVSTGFISAALVALVVVRVAGPLRYEMHLGGYSSRRRCLRAP